MAEINLLYEFHRGANCKYFDKMLGCELFPFTVVHPTEFLSMDFSVYNVLVYQTFPDSKLISKFNPKLAEVTDKKFLSFHGLKILLDSHDGKEKDAYERFGGRFPRIKNMAGVEYRKKFEVVGVLGGVIKNKLDVPLPEIPRTISVHCAFKVGVYPHKIREQVMGILKSTYSNVTSFERVLWDEFGEFLRKVQIEVVAPGFGETSDASGEALQARALLFAHEAMRNIKYLPHADLIDGEDYVLFNLDNMEDKLLWLLSSPEEVDRIRLNGQRKFFEGFDYMRSAKAFKQYLEGVLGL